MSIRTERVAGEIQKAISSIFREDLSYLTSGGLVTVTAVKVTPDLRHCKIYLSIISIGESRAQTMEKIEKDKSKVRMALARTLNLRYVPELAFFLDDTQDEVDKIERLFKEIHDRERAADSE